MKHFAEARPYAHAAYLFAKEHHQVELWHEFLVHLAKFFSDGELKRLFKNPKITAAMLVELLSESFLCTNSEMRNFLALLAQKKRLSLLPEISEVFEKDWARDQNLNEVLVTFAAEPDHAALSLLTDALQKEFGIGVKLKTHIDPAIMSGAIIQRGDHVFDGSLKGQLDRLRQELVRA